MPHSARSVADVDIFRGIDAAVLAEVEKVIRWRSAAPDHTLVEHEASTRDFYCVARGLVKVTTFSPAGREVEFRNLPAGTSFGELSAIDNKPRSASVVALQPTEFGIISQTDFLTLLQRHPTVALAVMRKLVTMVRDLSGKVFEFATEDVRTRILHEILRLAQAATRDGRVAHITPAPKQTAIANRCSTHREAVARTFGDLKRRGLLRREQGTLVVSDIPKLQMLIDSESD